LLIAVLVAVNKLISCNFVMNFSVGLSFVWQMWQFSTVD